MTIKERAQPLDDYSVQTETRHLLTAEVLKAVKMPVLIWAVTPRGLAGLVHTIKKHKSDRPFIGLNLWPEEDIS
jgi:hypothetical protein